MKKIDMVFAHMFKFMDRLLNSQWISRYMAQNFAENRHKGLIEKRVLKVTVTLIFDVAKNE